jgi:hypothetical protein
MEGAYVTRHVTGNAPVSRIGGRIARGLIDRRMPVAT